MMFESLFFLLGLYFMRHIPISIFWGLCSLFPAVVRPKQRLAVLKMFASISVISVFLILFSILIFILNILIVNNFHLTILPILLTEEIARVWNYKIKKDRYYSLLLSLFITQKRYASSFQFILRIVEFGALIFIGVGLIDILNDVLSHKNPDLFDILFPLGGALPFYGGITILSITAFFIYFVFRQKNIQRWRKRLQIAQKFPAGLRDFAVSKALLHHYFFLSAKGRSLTRKNNISTQNLILLFKKALLENIDQVPEEWLTRK